MPQKLETLELVSPEQFLSEILHPSFSTLLIGENHWVDQNVKNDVKIIEEARKRGRNLTLFVENLCSELIDGIPKTPEGREYLRKLAFGELSVSDHNKEENMGRRFYWPLFKAGFDNGILRSYGFNGTDEGLLNSKKKVGRLADILNANSGNGNLNIAICGLRHLQEADISQLIKQKDSFVHVTQDKEYEGKIVRMNRHNFGLGYLI